jgi:hypothetical protein
MADHRARIAHDFALGRFSFARKNNKIGLGERARALCMEVVALEWLSMEMGCYIIFMVI